MEPAGKRKLKILGRERRKEVRVERRFPAEVEILSFPNGGTLPKESFHCVTFNVSHSGARIALEMGAGIPTGTVAHIRVKCGHIFNRFDFIGTVRTVRRVPQSTISYVGFEFEPSPERDMKAWRTFVARYFSPIRKK